ncbi:MAG: hypothetical protein AAB531_05690 [Patescibacteria group bacterium]
MNLTELSERSQVLESVDSLLSTEIPTNIVKFELPDVMSGVRLGMHTDTVGNLLRVLMDFPESPDLRFEARQLNSTQRRELDRNMVYRFYMSGRFVRSGEDYGIVLPTGFSPKDGEVSRWANSSFSPSTLAREIGYRIAYIDLSGRIPGNPQDQHILMGEIGGCNELNIGSDIVDSSRLSAIAEQIKQRLAELDIEARASNVLIPPSSSFYILSNISKDKSLLNSFILQKDNYIGKYPINNIINHNYKIYPTDR